jgi:N-acyl-D-aspartate/D-glutamate deacylase
MTDLTNTDERPATQILLNPLVVDGTGAPGRRADVLIEGDRVVAVGDLDAPSGATRVDLDGLVLAPGFVDIHTHYDAQVLWDPDLSPSSWHGVTTVVMGNCGIGLAPTRAEHRDLITRSLVNVEGMSEEALRAGIDWSFETFPQYVAALRARQPLLNVEMLVAHSPLRVYVMGGDAFEREATASELDEMAALMSDAVQAGALGFGTSRSPNHQADEGRPLPSRLASVDELVQLGRAAASVREKPVIELAVGGDLSVTELSSLAERTGASVTWTAILAGRRVRGRSSADLLDEVAGTAAALWPQVTCLPVRIQFTLLDPPSAFTKYPTFAEALAVPRSRRAEAYTAPGWVDRAAAEIGREWDPLWARTYLVTEQPDGTEVAGASIAQLAAERGRSPLDTLVAVSLERGLEARFDVILANDDADELGELLLDRRTLLGLSDAGAHASQLCDAGYATHLLGHWWRDTGTLPLEHAVWRLTGQPAAIFGLRDRGCIRPGGKADLVAFDPGSVAASQPRRVRDLPSGADRLVSTGRGIEQVWVNGRVIRRDGRPVARVRPGLVAGR